MDDCFNYGSHHELAGKKVEVKSATPRGSGPVGPSTGRGPIGQRGPLPERPGFVPRQEQAYPFPGQMGPPNYGMQFPAMARWASMAVCVAAVPSHVVLADLLGVLHASCGHQALLGLLAGQVVAGNNLQAMSCCVPVWAGPLWKALCMCCQPTRAAADRVLLLDCKSG